MASPASIFILLVNDRADALSALEAALAPAADEQILQAPTARAGLEFAAQHEIAAAVLDIQMPEMDGFQLAERLRADPRTRLLPIIFVSAFDPTPAALDRIYALGASDFLPSPVNAKALRAKVAVFVELFRRQKALEHSAKEATQRALRALSEQQERLRLFTETASDYALFFLEPDGTVCEWSASAEKLFGWKAEAMVGRPADVVFTPEDISAAAPERELATARKTGQALDERWHMRANGTRFFATGRLVALRDAAGTLRGFAKILRDATQQKRTEEQLRDTVARFQTLADNIAQLAWMTDRDGAIFWYNRRWFDYTGTTIEEMRGWGWQNVHHPDHVDRVVRKFRHAIAAGSNWEDTFPLRARDGTYRWFLSRAIPFRNAQDEIVGWFGTNTDVHETVLTELALKKSESALRASEEQFRAFFESAAAGHVSVDAPSGRFARVNQRFCDITGYAARELLAMEAGQLTHPDDRAIEREMEQRLRAGAPEVAVELRILRKDGATVWTHVTSTLLRDAHGAPHTQICIVQDVTERKQAERALVESGTQLQLAIEAAELGTFFHDEATGEMEWNARTKALLGYPPEVAGSIDRFFVRLHPEDRTRIFRAWFRGHHAGSAGHVAKLEFRVIWPDGSLHHLFSASRSVSERRVDGTNVVRLIGTVRDITAAKEFEQALQSKVVERTAALEEKSAQLESFTYTVAHDLRSPLRAISGYADFIAQDFGAALAQDGLEYLRKIKASASRLDLLIQDMLAYSRITQVDLTLDNVPLDLSVDWARQQLLAEIEQKSAVIEIARPLPVVRGERGILDQVLLNLLSNALKFTPPGTAPRVEIFASDHGNFSRLSVRDNGIGIAPAYHERIFKVFERLREAREYPGTGVGLAIVAKAAERLGGRIGVESAPGRGSTFWIELPKPSS